MNEHSAPLISDFIHSLASLPALQPLLDTLPFGLVITDASLRLVQVNRWVVENLGREFDQLRGFSIEEVFPELKRRNLLQAYQMVLQTRLPLTLSTRIHRYFLHAMITQGGQTREMPQSASIIPLFEKERLVGTVTVVSNVSERMATEQALQREVDKLNALHEIDHALATLDMERCLQVIVDRTSALFDAQTVVLYLFRSQSQHHDLPRALQAVAVHPADAGEIPGMALAYRLGEQRQADLDCYFIQEGEHTRERFVCPAMGAPLLEQEACLGVLVVQSYPESGYTQDDLGVLEMLASRAAVAIRNAQLHLSEQTQRQFAETLRQVSLTLTADLDLDLLLDTLLDTISQVIPYDGAGVFLAEGDCLHLRRARGQALFDRQVVEDDSLPVEWAAPYYHSVTSAPIIVRGRKLGLLVLGKGEADFYTRELADQLAAFAAHMGIALENARLYAEQQQLAITDGLTGLFNRRRFDEVLAKELGRGQRYHHATALVMMDIDNFKRYNDSYGHPAGDRLLKAIAGLLRMNIRAVDTPVRYGGEEFAVILPETDLSAAGYVAERVRLGVEDLASWQSVHEFQLPDLRITISLGVAVAPDQVQAGEELIRAADHALYQAKKSGKNRVVLFDGQLAP